MFLKYTIREHDWPFAMNKNNGSYLHEPNIGIYDHRRQKTRHPVRSALDKRVTFGLVFRWVTIRESPMLYVCFLGLLFRAL